MTHFVSREVEMKYSLFFYYKISYRIILLLLPKFQELEKSTKFLHTLLSQFYRFKQ